MVPPWNTWTPPLERTRTPSDTLGPATHPLPDALLSTSEVQSAELVSPVTGSASTCTATVPPAPAMTGASIRTAEVPSQNDSAPGKLG